MEYIVKYSIGYFARAVSIVNFPFVSHNGELILSLTKHLTGKIILLLNISIIDQLLLFLIHIYQNGPLEMSIVTKETSTV